MRNALTLPDGSRCWRIIETTNLLNIAPIKRSKIAQKAMRDIEIRLVVERPHKESEISVLREHFTDQFGFPFNWKFVFLDEFPPQPGDKIEHFVSEVA